MSAKSSTETNRGESGKASAAARRTRPTIASPATGTSALWLTPVAAASGSSVAERRPARTRIRGRVMESRGTSRGVGADRLLAAALDRRTEPNRLPVLGDGAARNVEALGAEQLDELVVGEDGVRVLGGDQGPDVA